MPVTVSSGFWGSNYSLISKGQAAIRLRKLFRKGNARVIGELAKELNGAAAGANTAVVTQKRIANGATAGNPVGNGGVRTIDTVTRINRVTTAADETLIDSIVQPTRFGVVTYPGDASGNGK